MKKYTYGQLTLISINFVILAGAAATFNAQALTWAFGIVAGILFFGALLRYLTPDQ